MIAHLTLPQKAALCTGVYLAGCALMYAACAVTAEPDTTDDSAARRERWRAGEDQDPYPKPKKSDYYPPV